MRISTQFQLLNLLLHMGPTLLVSIGGLIACILYWRRAPAVAATALVGIATMLLAYIGVPVFQMWIIQTYRRMLGTIGTMMMIISTGQSILSAAGLACVIAAVFMKRKQASMGFEIPMATRACESQA